MMTGFPSFTALFLLFITAAGLPAGPVFAAEEQPASAEEKMEEPAREETQKAPGRTENKAAHEMYESISRFMMNLGEAERQHFYLTYSNYNLIRTVDTVRSSVAKAVDACSENNPEMEKKLRERFTKWDSAVQPVYEEAEASIDNMIIAQEYAEPKKIRALFEKADKTREALENEFDKVPVTTPEACEYMLGKMDETEQSMTSLLRATMVSYPQSLPGYVPPAEEENAAEPESTEDNSKE